MRYAIVIEKADGNYSAYVPDLPGCVATGASIEEIEHTCRKPSPFTWRAFARTALSSPRLPAGLSILKRGCNKHDRQIKG